MRLNLDQQRAVDCGDSSILCLAAAGSGKTFTLIERVAKLVDSGTDPSSILVLTFTNAAAFEMQERFRRRCSNCDVQFRTFHSFCYSLLYNDSAVRSRLGYTSCPSIPSEATQTLIDRTVCKIFNIKLSKKKRQGKEILSLKDQQEYVTYMKGLEVEYKRRNLITFDQLCYKVCELFTSKDPCVLTYLDQYKHVLCDEFQDTDPRQFQFLLAFSNSSIFLVGDVLQAIYEFRGADSTICKTIAEHPQDAYGRQWQVITLPLNYRSDRAICEFANNHSVYAKSAHRLQMISNSAEQGTVNEEYLSGYCPVTAPVSPSVLKDIKSIAHDHRGSLAVLARTNAEVLYIRNYLSSEGVIGSSITWMPDSLGILRAGQDLDYAEKWCASLMSMEHYADYIVWNRYKDSADEARCSRWDQFTAKFGKFLPNINYLECIESIHNIFQSTQHPCSKCVSILKLLAPAGTFADMSLKDDTAVVKYIEDLIIASPVSDVYVGTIHSAKGLEYDHVVLVNVDGTSFRLTSEANNNLYYVGITRARHILDVYRYVN